MPPTATWVVSLTAQLPTPALTTQTKLKVQLKLAIARLRMVQQRDEQVGKTHRRAMAQLLEAGKIDSATIRVENIIRADITSELHELLELYCELLLARAGLLEGPTCDAGLEEAVKSLVYAAPKTEIKELVAVRGLLGDKYGKEFVLAAMENADGKVSAKVVRKLSVEPPRGELVQGYLEEIARAYGVEWPRKPKEDPVEAAAEEALVKADLVKTDDEDEDGDDGRGHLAEATPPRNRLGGPKSPLTVTAPRMTTDNVHPKVTLGSVELRPSGKEGEPGGAVPDIGDLEKRFAALKR